MSEEAKLNVIGRSSAVALWGLAGKIVSIEACVSAGLPGIDIVGLPDASVSESRKRLRAALAYLGIPVATQHVTINLTPGSVPKIGTGFDLGIAVAVLKAQGVITQTDTESIIHCGELGLDGRIRPVNGVLPSLHSGLQAGFERFVVPVGNAEESALLEGTRVRAVNSLAELINIYGGTLSVPLLPPVVDAETAKPETYERHDLAEVQGQAEARFGLEVAAAGGHNLLMRGTPGAGKTLLAQCLPGILPSLDDPEAVEVAAVRSLRGELRGGEGLDHRPPFEAPHHRSTASALIGGRRPGSIGILSRAHRGVLFMDEAPEFSRDVLEALRQPMEARQVHIHRAWGSMVLPASFQLVMAANPCPCGAGMRGAESTCRCTPMDKRRYRNRLSGPLLDRVDLQLELFPVSPADIRLGGMQEDSSTVAGRVRRARQRQADRYVDCEWALNSNAPGAWLREHFAMSPNSLRDLDRALDTGRITMRGYDRVLRVATTLADLEGAEAPSPDRITTALALRTQDS
ncbi:MAG: YifB family Mg chelatase-like AAA ATPase [Brevibacterium sp.]|uniref:YifB family Mg chelatase-like AAA ATPase n=1 Tax=Brevibacterium sp. TaxID=1701 RepID=UPI00264725D3|nr:YifB family Mg chelatase-like AAA ATPase [Brevibacterium sp.]MDN5807515.1 YifB family Mg chelatase-like AAA ATPase [Brevibacterium sp.]MDN5833343.1 YifB family Mg chelatase-like AAA ATPase [Brevibacterium sp.]MDN5877006.1 YifB family Mg chelatase-like AAA ATPase [Brevibacterium sp.]MDN5908638.1 YifB family Mg chelatase-like AAA ATPase [Brevibacterium sp.]MDN6133452.1 YifB family Mg chelatase-like AAA ATPase [Brevibacterium sp.]